MSLYQMERLVDFQLGRFVYYLCRYKIGGSFHINIRRFDFVNPIYRTVNFHDLVIVFHVVR